MTETLRPHPHLIFIGDGCITVRVFVAVNLQLFLSVVTRRATPLHSVLLVESPAILGLLSAI